MKYFFHYGPPFTVGACVERLLTRFAERPPFLGDRIGCHLLHIGLVIRSHIFVVTEQQPVFVINRIVANIALANGL